MLNKEEFHAMVEKVFAFHRKRAPGLAIGVAMVDYALELLGPVKGKLNMVTETQACLSDVIQVMTGCTVGNRYLRVLADVGRFALTAFDREDGRGIRVFCKIDAIDAKKTPELKNFFHRTRDEEVQKGGPARDLSCDKIMAEFAGMGRSLFGVQQVFVKQYGKPAMLPARICPQCGESFLSRGEAHTQCDVCSKVQEYCTIAEKRP